MDSKTIEDLIRYYKAGLAQYRMLMGPAVQVLVERTIKALRELKDRGESDN